MSRREVWRFDREERVHEVTITDRGLGRRVDWAVDGASVDNHWTMDDRTVRVVSGHGAIGLHFTALGRTRRVSWFDVDSEAAAHAANQIPLSGQDFEPEPDSKAARRLEWMREHPRLYTARSGLIAALGVILGIVAVSLLGQLVVRLVVRIPWPEWRMPDIPWPDWSLPRPEWLPTWDLPDWDLPPWAATVASAMKYIVPVVIAVAIAYAETRRRRRPQHHDRPERHSPPGRHSLSERHSPPEHDSRPEHGDESERQAEPEHRDEPERQGPSQR